MTSSAPLYMLALGETCVLHRCGCVELHPPFMEFGQFSTARVALRVARIDRKGTELCAVCLKAKAQAPANAKGRS